MRNNSILVFIIGIFIVGFVLGLTSSAMIVRSILEKQYKIEAIKHSHAQYDQLTGEWEWK